MNYYKRALEIQADAVKYRHHLHKHPELSGQEFETAAYIASILDSFGIQNQIVNRHAVVGLISGKGSGKCVALRADIDALASEDKCGASYQSVHPGVCHACGHDVHTAALLSAARMLQESSHDFPGQVKLIFQPSEERPPSGAAELIAANVMDGVDAIFGTHVVNFINAGDVSVQAGPRLAGSMNFYVDIYGKGGHGAMPHECIDPIVAAAAVIMNLQSIVSREMNPADSVSVTVGKIEGGTAHHSIAESVHFRAAIKSMNADIRDQIAASVRRIVETTAETYRCTAKIEMTPFGKPLINDAALSKIAEQSAAELLGKTHVITCAPWPVSEDFTKYLEYAPGLFALVGGRNEEQGFVLQNHHPAFDVDESALAAAAALYAGFAADYLRDTSY